MYFKFEMQEVSNHPKLETKPRNLVNDQKPVLDTDLIKMLSCIG